MKRLLIGILFLVCSTVQAQEFAEEDFYPDAGPGPDSAEVETTSSLDDVGTSGGIETNAGRYLFSISITNNSNANIELQNGYLVNIVFLPGGKTKEQRAYRVIAQTLAPGETVLLDDNYLTLQNGRYFIYNQNRLENEEEYTPFLPDLPPGTYRVKPMIRFEDGKTLEWNSQRIVIESHKKKD